MGPHLWWFSEPYRNPVFLEPCQNPGSPNAGFAGCFKIGIPMIPEPLETMVKVPATLSKAKCTRNLPGILTSRNPKGSKHPEFPEPFFLEPFPEPWFPEPWVPVPGTLPRTLVPGVPGTGETRRHGRAAPRSTPKAIWAETPRHSVLGEQIIFFYEDIRHHHGG